MQPQMAHKQEPGALDALTGPVLSDGERWKQVALSHRETYETFARQSGFSLEFSATQDTCFDHEKCALVLNIPQMVNLAQGDERKFHYIILHELGHLKELSDDPVGYERLIKEAESLGGRGNLIFRLYNSLMDIYVNTNSANRAPEFAAKRGSGIFSPMVHDLYRSGTFPDRDLSKLPHAIQYAYALLNIGMEVGNDLAVSPEVDAALNTSLKMASGRKVSHQKLIDTYLRPVLGSDNRLGEEWKATIGQRKGVIDRTIRPIFEELLDDDIKEGRITEKQMSEYGQSTKVSRDLLNEMKRIVKERNASAADKAQDLIKNQAEKGALEAGLSPQEAKDFAECYQRAYPQMVKLAEIWRSLRDQVVTIKFEEHGYFKDGNDLCDERVIDQFPDLQEDPESVEVHLRQVPVERRVMQPRKIWLIASIDCSGSMTDVLESTRETVVALAGSIALINKEEGEAGEILEGQFSAVGFDSVAKVILHAHGITRLAEIAKSYKEVSADNGTSDHLALELVEGWLKEDVQSQIDQGEVLPIFIEITDGDTSDPILTIKAISRLNKRGIRTAAIQFGGTVALDRQPDPIDLRDEAFDPIKARQQQVREGNQTSFGEIWGESGYRVSGVKQVPGAIAEALKGLIGLKELH